jgi:hypothetical protein
VAQGTHDGRAVYLVPELGMEYSMDDRLRLILLGIVTAAICAVMISASFVHLTI